MVLREVLARFGINVDAKQLAGANAGIGNAIGSLKTFGAVLAGSAIIGGFSSFIKETVSMGDKLGKTSAQLGIGTKELQQWQVAAQLSGASVQELTTGIRTLAKNSLLAQTSATGEAAKGFKKLGIATENVDGSLKNSSQLLRETGLALGAVTNNTERTALAQQLLGRAGTKLIPIFTKGGAELDTLLGKLEEFGGGLGEDAIKQSEDVANQFLFWDIASDSLRSTLATSLLPTLSKVIAWMARGLGAFSRLTKNTQILQTAFLFLGSAIAKIAFAKLAAVGVRGMFALGKAVLIPLLKFALLFLLVDDLLTLFKGGDSVIGRFLDKLFGKGSSAAFVKEIGAIGSALKDLIFNFGETNKTADGFVTDNETRFVKLASAIASSTDQIVKDFAEAWELAKQDMSNFADDMITAGEELLDGLIQGIKNKASEAVDAIAQVGSDVIAGAKKVFGSKSPSKKFEAEGENNIDGLVLGMTKAARAASRLGASAAGTAAGMGSNSASAPASGGTGRSTGGIIFRTEINIPITGGMPSEQQVNTLRQGVSKSLDDNRRATLAALQQVIQAP